MSEFVKQYSIGSGIVEKHEAKILTDLPTIYPDEAQRQIVESVLIPHFRAELNKVFIKFGEEEAMSSDQPVVPSRLPGLCEAVDGMIKENRILLDLDGMFEPLMERIQVARGEIAEALKAQFYQHCRDILAGHGVVDRQSLLKKGPVWFMQIKFPPYGKGPAFAGKILGRVMDHVRFPDLEQIADVLGFEKPSREEKLQKYRAVLAGHGVTDRQSLLDKGSRGFSQTDFSPYGKGIAFATEILGMSAGHGHVSSTTLEEIADVLGFKNLSREDKLKKYRNVLSRHKVTNRQGLLDNGPALFKDADFPPYGKGKAFATEILGRPVGRYVYIATLEEIADILGFKKLSRERELQKYQEVLEGQGITGKQSLLDKGSKWFKRADFSPYGKGSAFAGEILGRVVRDIRIVELEQIANTLWPDTLSNES